MPDEGFELPTQFLVDSMGNPLNQRSGIITNQQNLIIPNNSPTSYQPRDSGLVIPEAKGFKIVDDEELKRLSAVPERKNLTKRSDADRIKALYDPLLFLCEDTKAKVSDQEWNTIKSILDELHDPDIVIDKTEAINRTQREVKITRFYNKNTGEYEEQTYSSAGPLETAAIKITNLMLEKDFDPRLFAPYLSQLLNSHREGLESVSLPEMPELSLKMIDLLRVFDAKKSRKWFYAQLEHLTLPPTQQEDLLQYMDKHGDLGEPIAFLLTQDLTRNNYDSTFLKKQERTKTEILQQLAGDPQALFENYELLQELSGKLVDCGTSRPKKIGLEIEYEREGRKYNLPDRFVEGRDSGAYELRTNKNDLEFSTEYKRDLALISLWLNDNATLLKSVHFHLDKQTHVNAPTLSGIFIGNFVSGDDNPIANNSLGTWEVRATNLPRTEGTFHPGRLAAQIEFFAEASSEKNNCKSKIQTDPSKNYEWKQILFGHFATVITSPEGRLLALKALEDPIALRNINPLAFLSSFSEDSIPSIQTALSEICTTETDKVYLNNLKQVSKGDPIYLLNELLHPRKKEKFWKTVAHNPELCKKLLSNFNIENDRDEYIFEALVSELIYYADPTEFSDVLKAVSISSLDNHTRIDAIKILGKDIDKNKNFLTDFVNNEESLTFRSYAFASLLSDSKYLESTFKMIEDKGKEEITAVLRTIISEDISNPGSDLENLMTFLINKGLFSTVSSEFSKYNKGQQVLQRLLETESDPNRINDIVSNLYKYKMSEDVADFINWAKDQENPEIRKVMVNVALARPPSLSFAREIFILFQDDPNSTVRAALVPKILGMNFNGFNLNKFSELVDESVKLIPTLDQDDKLKVYKEILEGLYPQKCKDKILQISNDETDDEIKLYVKHFQGTSTEERVINKVNYSVHASQLNEDSFREWSSKLLRTYDDSPQEIRELIWSALNTGDPNSEALSAELISHKIIYPDMYGREESLNLYKSASENVKLKVLDEISNIPQIGSKILVESLKNESSRIRNRAIDIMSNNAILFSKELKSALLTFRPYIIGRALIGLLSNLP